MRVSVRGAWEVVSTMIVVAAAITMLTLYLQDRKRSVSASESGQAFVDDWRDWGESAVRMGAEDATMVVALFMDFTCPFCRKGFGQTHRSFRHSKSMDQRWFI